MRGCASNNFLCNVFRYVTSVAPNLRRHELMDLEMSRLQDATPFVKNILLFDSEGKHVAVKYFSDDWPTNSKKSEDKC